MSHSKNANDLKGLSFTTVELQVVIGCLLGDGTLTQSGKEYRLRIEHKAAHREYVEWKYRRLQRFCVTPPQFSAQHQSYRFGTVGHPKLTELRNVFYGGGKKSIPVGIETYISPLALAILFMDDGGKIHNTVSLAIHCYADPDAEIFRRVLRKQGIETTLQYDGHGYGRRLYISTSSYAAFKTLVKPYVNQIVCMAYKLP